MYVADSLSQFSNFIKDLFYKAPNLYMMVFYRKTLDSFYRKIKFTKKSYIKYVIYR